MTNVYLLLGILLPWVIVGSILRTYQLEKEGVIFLLIYTSGLYLVVSFKNIYTDIRRFILNIILFHKNFNPVYFSNLFTSNAMLKTIYCYKTKKYLESKQIINEHSYFLNHFFLSLELSLKKEECFYSLLPVIYSSRYSCLNIKLHVNNFLKLIYSILDESELKKIELKNYLNLANRDELGVSEISTILLNLCIDYPKIKEEISIHYRNYFKDKRYYIQLFLSTSEDLIKNDIFPLMLLLENNDIQNCDFVYLKTEGSELYNTQHSFISMNYHYMKNNKNLPFMFQHKYLAINFMEDIKQKINNNNFIDQLISVLEIKNSICMGTISDELQLFTKQMDQLKLYNNLRDTLMVNENKSKKIFKI